MIISKKSPNIFGFFIIQRQFKQQINGKKISLLLLLCKNNAYFTDQKEKSKKLISLRIN